LDLSERLAALARARLPAWSERIFTGNSLYWHPPFPFDFVGTELVYVPASAAPGARVRAGWVRTVEQRQAYVERLLEHVVAPAGRLIVCSYGSSRPEGLRSEALVDEFDRWGTIYGGVADFVSP
jgi:hypothetical protein